MKANMYEEKFMRFPYGKSKAVTFSYDDNVPANKKLLSLFKKYGARGTFNLNSKLFDYPNWNNQMNEEEFLNTFLNCGQEIALHGAKHIFLNKVPLTAAVKEIADNRDYLERTFGTIVNGMAYAYGAFNDDIVKMLEILGVKYARTTISSHGFAIPEDWLHLNPTCHHTEKEFPALAEKFLSCSPEKERKQRDPLLFYLWGHAYEFDNDNNWHVIEDFLKNVSQDKNIWLATNGEVYDYVKAYERLEYSFTGEIIYNPSATDVWLDVRGGLCKVAGGEKINLGGDK